MQMCERGVQHPARGFRIPIIDTREDGEDRTRRDDIMEVANDVVGVVQVEIDSVKRQRNARETTDAKHG